MQMSPECCLLTPAGPLNVDEETRKSQKKDAKHLNEPRHS